MDVSLRFIKFFIPNPIFKVLQPAYHLFLARAAALIYGFPSRRLKVVGVTGTNGKSTVVHLITSILEEAGEKTASVSSLRFRINSEERKNTLKMTMPGRFQLQKFLRQAVRAGCKYAVLEVTSEGIKQFRHIGINFNIAVLTNVTPEHLESHGGFDAYRAAKAELFKKSKIHVLNGDDPSIEYFLKISAESRIIYSKKDLPADFKLKMLGDFNVENAVAAYHVGKILGIDRDAIKQALEKIEFVPGRLEFIQKLARRSFGEGGEPFAVVVDYAHTPDALRKVYETLRREFPISNFQFPNKSQMPNSNVSGFMLHAPRLICVLGSAGGGRDKWKRPEMGKIAAEFCDEIILTNEDPYDESPNQILSEIESGISNFQFTISKQISNPKIPNLKKILDRREAIREALKSAQPGDIVIITGKGAEPWIMGPNGTKTPWDDREVVREELKKLEK